MLPDLKKTSGDQLFVGIVRDNKDPAYLQRVRVEIPGLLESSDLSLLPWFIPHHVSPYGIGDDYGVLRIPRVGARVYVRFQEGDGSFGVYLADTITKASVLPDELKTNYGNRVGFYTPAGDVFYLDMDSYEILFRRQSGTALKIDKDGNVNLVVGKDFTQVVQGDYSLVVKGKSAVTVQSDASFTANGLTTQISGDLKETVSGAQSTIVSGNRTISCSSEKHAGDITNAGDVIANGVSLTNHKHGGVDTGGGLTQPPIPG